MEVATEAVHSDRKMQMLGLLAMDGAEGVAEQQQRRNRCEQKRRSLRGGHSSGEEGVVSLCVWRKTKQSESDSYLTVRRGPVSILRS